MNCRLSLLLTRQPNKKVFYYLTFIATSCHSKIWSDRSSGNNKNSYSYKCDAQTLTLNYKSNKCLLGLMRGRKSVK